MLPSSPKHVYITVGSTSFDELINVAISPETVEQFKQLGILRVVIQTGNYAKDIEWTSFTDIDIRGFRYTDNFADEIMKADLVIGHAGAGTCLEALRLKKRLLVVTNDELMAGHQDELADQLAEDGYLVKTRLEDFHENLDVVCRKKIQLKEFPDGSHSQFEDIFNEALMKARIY